MEEAQNRVSETTDKLAMVDHYKNTYDLSLNYKIIEKFDTQSLEFAYRMLLLEKAMHAASSRIARFWRGYKARSKISVILRTRKRALLLI